MRKAVILVDVLSRVFCLCSVLLGCDSLCCLNVVLLGCCGSLGGLMGTRCWEKRGYGLRGSTWAQLEVGNRGWWVYARIVDVESLLCTIARPPPSTTCDGYPIILQAWDEEVLKGETSCFYSLTTEWYLEICRGGQETLGTSGGVLLPKTKLDQSRPNPDIVGQREPVMYLSRRAPGSQQIKGKQDHKARRLVVAGQLWNLIDMWDMVSGNRLPRVGNRLQGLKMKTGG